jgi:glycosyltransferase involved in cell wall biosynthesis
MNFFGKQASKNLTPNGDILLAGSSSALDAIRCAKKIGYKVTILERGSSHIEYQYKILLQEQEKYGITRTVTHKKIIAKELLEYQEADYISVPSNFVKSTFLEYGIPSKKILLNPYGVDLSQFQPKFPSVEMMNDSDGVFRIIHCGGINLRKGVQYLLAAFSRLNLPNSELLLIGSMSEEFKPIYNTLKTKNVHHLGPFPQKELVKQYQKGSIFCLASIEEGLAMVIPQAMACGLPIVCTVNTGGGDIVRDGVDGYVIPIRDLDALCGSIKTLYSDPLLRCQMGINARERVSQDFGWDDYARRAEKIFSDLLR